MEAEFVSHPDSRWRPIDPAMGNSFGSYSESGTQNSCQAEASPMVRDDDDVTPELRRRRRGEGVRSHKHTVYFFPSYFSSFIFNFSFRLSRISPTVRTMFRHIKIYVKYASLSTVFPKALHIIARAPVFSVSPSTSVGSCIIDDSRAVEL